MGWNCECGMEIPWRDGDEIDKHVASCPAAQEQIAISNHIRELEAERDQLKLELARRAVVDEVVELLRTELKEANDELYDMYDSVGPLSDEIERLREALRLCLPYLRNCDLYDREVVVNKVNALLEGK